MTTIAPTKALKSGILCIASLMLLPTLAQAAVAGRIQFAAGEVRITDDKGAQRAAQKGADVNEGDSVATAANASAQIKMVDGAMIAVRPDTQLKIDAYVFKGAEDESEGATLSLLKGGLRAITGLIGTRSKERFKLRTPNGSIGIRGTDHEPVVVLPPAPGETSGIPAGTYDKVNLGATSLTTQAGTTLILPNQVGFAASPTQQPMILPKMPDFYKASATPQAKTEQKQDKQQAAQQETASTAKAETSDTKPLAPIQTAALTGTDADGNKLDLSTQSLTTRTGEVVQIDGARLRGVGIADGWGQNFSKESGPFDNSALFHGNIDGDVQPSANVADNAGGLQSFNGRASGYLLADGNTSASNSIDTPAKIKIGSAINRDVGSASVGGITLNWGRWEGGTIDIYTPDGASRLGTINNADRSVHWLTTSPLGDNAFQLPLTGSAKYTVIGHTAPTDLQGNTGSLGAVTLNADFANARADASVNVSFKSPTNTSDWNMTASNMPLTGQDGFESNTSQNGTNGIKHTVSCSGASCGAQSVGGFDGHILGNTQGALLIYSMATGSTTSTSTKPGSPTAPDVFKPANIVTGLVILKQ